MDKTCSKIEECKKNHIPTDLSTRMLNDGRVFNGSGLPDAAQQDWHSYPFTVAVIHKVYEIKL